MKIIDEFKEFAIRGNAVDLAVGIVIGAGFTKIVTSLVEDIIMPPLSILTGGVDFTDKALTLREASAGSEALTIQYGTFISIVLEFAIVAFAIFLVVRYINALKRGKTPTKEKTEPKPTLCPYCREGIAKEATRCPHCTATLHTS